MCVCVCVLKFINLPPQILFTIDRLQAVSDTLTAVTGGSHGHGEVGVLHHGHYQGEVSPPPGAVLSPTPPGNGNVKLKDIYADLSLPKDKSEESKVLEPGTLYVLCSHHLSYMYQLEGVLGRLGGDTFTLVSHIA